MNQLYENQIDYKVLTSQTKIGDTQINYTFGEKVKTGLVIVSASQNESPSNRTLAEISSLSTGKYTELDNNYETFNVSSVASHRSHIYLIQNVEKDSTIVTNIRYGGMLQIIKLIFFFYYVI